jgi:hypothetical protein
LETVTIVIEELVIFKKKLKYLIMQPIKQMLLNIFQKLKIVEDISRLSHKVKQNNSRFGKMKKKSHWPNQVLRLIIKMIKQSSLKDLME